MLKEAGALLVITLIAGLLLGFIYELTKKPRAYQKELAVTKACNEVMPNGDKFEEIEYSLSDETLSALSENGVTVGTVYESYDKSGSFIGYVVESKSSQGYNGDIVLYLGIDPAQAPANLIGVSILKISETPGLGMRAQEVLVPQFKNKAAQSFMFTKTGATSDNEIDAISGATITTRAFTNAVNGGLNAAIDIYEKAVAEGRF
ncbi:MAG: RnfABCDGE type electron transport complex subunit G [Lachnospiraceae bacterium]|nr:RnfABCDGE type electron transport complex subunit G [Lachnospiraceae bacterium]